MCAVSKTCSCLNSGTQSSIQVPRGSWRQAELFDGFDNLLCTKPYVRRCDEAGIICIMYRPDSESTETNVFPAPCRLNWRV